MRWVGREHNRERRDMESLDLRFNGFLRLEREEESKERLSEVQICCVWLLEREKEAFIQVKDTLVVLERECRDHCSTPKMGGEKVTNF